MPLTLDLALRPFALGTEPAIKACTVCRVDLPIDAFRRNHRGRLGVFARCRDCMRAVDKAYNSTPERKAAERARTQTPEHRTKQRARDAARMAEQCAKKSRRRAVLKGATVAPFSSADLRAHWDDAGYYACYWCDAPFTDAEPLHEDHVFPISQGGAHALSNLVPAHRSCNTSKGARDPHDFARELHPWI